MTVLWGLLIITFIISAAGMLPTRWYTAPAMWILRRYRLHGARILTHELARRSIGVPFTPSVSFLPRNAGLAIDAKAQKLFLVSREDGRLNSVIVPFADVTGVSQGERRDSGFYDYYVDVQVKGTADPWRIVCGEEPDLAAAMKTALDAALKL